MSVLCKNYKSFKGKEYAAFGNMSLLLSLLVQSLTQLALKFYSKIFLNCNVSLSCLQSLAQILFFILVHVHFFLPLLYLEAFYLYKLFAFFRWMKIIYLSMAGEK